LVVAILPPPNSQCQAISPIFASARSRISDPSIDEKTLSARAVASTCVLQNSVERLQALVSASRLDNVINKSDLYSAVTRFQRADAFDRSFAFRRRSVFGKEIVLPAIAVTRRWATSEGRTNIRRDMVKRMNRLLDLDEESTERFKLFTVTFRGVEESWRAQKFISRLTNKILQWSKRRGKKVSYLWVGELQKRCALHYHLVFAGLPFVPKPVWKRWSPAPQSKMEAASARKASFYIAKYIRKSTADNPKSGELATLLFAAAGKRHFGSSRNVSHKETTDAAWVRELQEFLDGSDAVADYVEDALNNVIYVWMESGEQITLDRREMKWRLILWLPTG